MKHLNNYYISLIEVMTAMTILGVLMTVILAGFSYNIRSTTMVEKLQQANFVLSKKMKDFEYKENLTAGVYHGQEKINNKEFLWFVNIRQEQFENIFEAEVKVEYSLRGEKRELKEFMLIPIQSKSK